MADVLGRTMRATMTCQESAGFRFEQEYYKQGVDFTKEHHARIVLGADPTEPEAIDMAGITSATSLFVQTDREIQLGLDSTDNMITLSQNGMFMLIGEFSAVYVLNTSDTYEATIEVVMTD